MKIELGTVLCVVSTGLSVLLHSMNRSNVRNINFDFIVIDVNNFSCLESLASCLLFISILEFYYFRQSNSFESQTFL